MFFSLWDRAKAEANRTLNLTGGIITGVGDVVLKVAAGSVGGVAQEITGAIEKGAKEDDINVGNLDVKDFAHRTLDPLIGQVEGGSFVEDLIPERQPDSIIEGLLGPSAAEATRNNPSRLSDFLVETDKFVVENFPGQVAGFKLINASLGAPTAGLFETIREEAVKAGIDPDRPGAFYNKPGNLLGATVMSVLSVSGLTGFWQTVRDSKLIDPDTGKLATTAARTRMALPHLMQALTTMGAGGRILGNTARRLTKGKAPLQTVGDPFDTKLRTKTDIDTEFAEKIGNLENRIDIKENIKFRAENVVNKIDRDKLFAPTGGETKPVVGQVSERGLLATSGILKSVDEVDLSGPELTQVLTNEAVAKTVKFLFDEEDIGVGLKASAKLAEEIGAEPAFMRTLSEMLVIEAPRFQAKVDRARKNLGLTESGATMVEAAKVNNQFLDLDLETHRQNLLTSGNIAGKILKEEAELSKLAKEHTAAHPEFLSNVELLSNQLEGQTALNNLMGMSLSFVTSLFTTVSRNIRGQSARTLLDAVENSINEGIVRRTPLDNVSRDALLHKTGQMNRASLRDALVADLMVVPDTVMIAAAKTLNRIESGGGITAKSSIAIRNKLAEVFPNSAKALHAKDVELKVWAETFAEVPKVQARLFGGLTSEGVQMQKTRFTNFRERFKTGAIVAGQALKETLAGDRPALLRQGAIERFKRRDTLRPGISKAFGAITATLSDQASLFNVADDMVQGQAAATMVLRRHALRNMDKVSAAGVLELLRKTPDERPLWLQEAFAEIETTVPKLTFRANPMGEGIISRYTKNTLDFLGRNPVTILAGIPPFLRFGYNKFQFLMERNPAVLVEYLTPRGRAKLHGAIDRPLLNTEMIRRNIKRLDDTGNITPEAQAVYDRASALMQREAATEIARGLTGSAMMTAGMVARRSPIAGPQFDQLDLSAVGIDIKDAQGNPEILNISSDDPWVSFLFFGEILNTIQEGGDAEDIGRKFTPTQITQNLLNFRNIKNTPFILTDLLRTFDGRGNVQEKAFEIGSKYLETPLGFITTPFRGIKDLAVIASGPVAGLGYEETAKALLAEGTYKQSDEFLGYDSAVSNLPTPLQAIPNLLAEIAGVFEPGRQIPEAINFLQGSKVGINSPSEAILRQFGLSFQALSPLSQKLDELGLRKTDLLGRTNSKAERNEREKALMTFFATPLTRGDGEVKHIFNVVEDIVLSIDENLPDKVKAELVKSLFEGIRNMPLAAGASIVEMAEFDAAMFRDPSTLWRRLNRQADEVAVGFLEDRQIELDIQARKMLKTLREERLSTSQTQTNP